ncbi:MAG: hypothetical protein ACU0BK_05730 [Shimia sp.]|jgi:uncharacterized protein YqgC (DUF456 family)|uniref:hypothetical protein n=1 Tax=Shimia sp. TaxID=1954381 RepID=UPI00405A19CF
MSEKQSLADQLAQGLNSEQAISTILMTNSLANLMPYLVFGLLLLAFVFVAGGLFQRIKTGKSIGWQFIRYSILGMALPLVAILALTDKFGAETAALFGAAIGYLFGKEDNS